jgi:hypothetical protein
MSPKMSTSYKVLTLDPLWAWAIFRGYKLVENRTWATKHRGPLVIHAGLNTRREALAREWMTAHTFYVPPTPAELAREIAGRCLGVVTLLDCVPLDQVPEREREFASGPVCWRIADPVEFEASFPAVGKQGLWSIEI